MKISPPNEFNDPFELTPRSKFTITPEHMIKVARTDPEHYRPVFEDMVRNEGYPHSFERFVKDLEVEIPRKFSAFKKLYRVAQIQSDLASTNEASKHAGIFCVSKIRDSIPMWSYYAGQHSGAVFGLDIASTSFPQTGEFDRVKYQTHRCPYDALLKAETPEWLAQIRRTIFAKSKCWAHEREHRRVCLLKDLIRIVDENEKVSYFIDIWGKEIQEVILGCRIAKQDEQLIRALLNKRKFAHVRLFRCERHKTKFQLDLIPA